MSTKELSKEVGRSELGTNGETGEGLGTDGSGKTHVMATENREVVLGRFLRPRKLELGRSRHRRLPARGCRRGPAAGSQAAGAVVVVVTCLLNPLESIQLCYEHVPGRRPRIHHHAHRTRFCVTSEDMSNSSVAVSRRMIASEHFDTVPEMTQHETPTARPRTTNFSARSHIGSDAQSSSARRLTFALHY